MNKLERSIEGISNALELLESLGYRRGGDIHDELLFAKLWLEQRKRAHKQQEERAKQWASGVPVSMRLP